MTEAGQILQEMGLDEYFPKGMLTNGKPSEVVRQLAIKVGKDFSREFALRTLNRMRMRGATCSTCAEAFDVKVGTIYQWNHELSQRLRREVETVDKVAFFGETIAYYNEMSQEALKAYTSTAMFTDRVTRHPDGSETRTRVMDGTAVRYKQSMFMASLSAKDRMLRWLEQMKFFEGAKVTGSENAEDPSQNVGNMIDMMLTADDEAFEAYLMQDEEQETIEGTGHGDKFAF